MILPIYPSFRFPRIYAVSLNLRKAIPRLEYQRTRFLGHCRHQLLPKQLVRVRRIRQFWTMAVRPLPAAFQNEA